MRVLTFIKLIVGVIELETKGMAKWSNQMMDHRFNPGVITDLPSWLKGSSGHFSSCQCQPRGDADGRQYHR